MTAVADNHAPARLTGVGAIVGTAAYMSPEQARGRAVDRRTDLWAFGCVLFEMIAGRRVFPGATVSDTIAAVLERSPDWTALPPATPPPVRHLLARCLEKDSEAPLARHRRRTHRARRWGGVATADGPCTAKTSRAAERAAWALLVALAAAVAAVATPMLRKAPTPAEIRFNLLFPRGVAADFAQLAISPGSVNGSSWRRLRPAPAAQSTVAADRGVDVGATADRNRRCELSVLVAGRPIDWVLCRWKVEAARRQQRDDSDPRRCPQRARWRMAARRHDSVCAERGRSAAECGDRWPANRRHPARGWTERSSRAVHPS